MRSALYLLAGCLGVQLILNSEIPASLVYRLEIADCDDISFGPEEDLYLACHSPEDRLQIPVEGAKA
jgi:hypothetical protein